MTKRLLPLMALLLALSVGAAVALTVSGGAADESPVTSADDIGADECSLVHNIDACGDGAGGQPPTHSDEGIDPNVCNPVPSLDAPRGGGDPCSAEEPDDGDFGIVVAPDGGGPATSADGIDPDECSFVHNVDGCD